MGWCSGTELFDVVVGEILELNQNSSETRIKAIVNVIKEFENHDWDCQDESEHYNHWVVKEAFKRVHPSWFSKSDVNDDINMVSKSESVPKNILCTKVHTENDVYVIEYDLNINIHGDEFQTLSKQRNTLLSTLDNQFLSLIDTENMIVYTIPKSEIKSIEMWVQNE